MQILFVPCKIVLVVLTVLFSTISLAQERTTKRTKIILAVNKQSDAVEHIELLANFQKIKKEKLLERYAGHKFFLGELKGTYKLDQNWIIPGTNTTIVMYTEKQYAPSEQFFKRDDLLPGDQFNLGEIQAKVITNKKGELTIKIEK